jgi:hypothetical protein
MFSVEAAREAWTRGTGSRLLDSCLTITDEGLVLGATVLAKMGRDVDGSPRLLIDDGEERIFALLAAAYGKAVGPAVLGNIRRASTEWGRGEPCLAQIHLAHSGLPRLLDLEEASLRLFVADTLLAGGFSPHELIKVCGLDPAPRALVKAGYSSNQPRVPAGNPNGGEWAGGGASPTTTAPVEPKVQLSDFKIVHGLQPDSVVVTPPDGVPIEDEHSDSPTGKLIAPPRANFQEVFAAGKEIASLSLSQQQQRGHDAIAQGGAYDFQRDVPHLKFYEAYEHASNYAVGVYMAGAGYSLQLTYLIAKYYALRHSSNYDAQDREQWIRRGWNDAKSGRWQ